MRKIPISQLTNKERNINAILDGYQNVVCHRLYMAEALQKDAIQNSWDARIDKENGKNWKCSFDLIRIGRKNFLTITDEGTKGLIGTKFDTPEKVRDILLSKRKDEDLANFCNSDWSDKKWSEGGNRGRGKTIFLAASKDKKIYFDSYRSSDKKYVLVSLYLDKDKEIKYIPYWNDEARRKLAKICDETISPLKKYGTRILILNPVSEINEAVTQGDFLSYINNTWWEIIKKYGAKIIVNNQFSKKIATLPMWYENNRKEIKANNVEEKMYSSNFIDHNNKINKIERIVLRYSPKQDVSKQIKGIAIQRGGMTIERLKTDDLVNEENISNIYGWVEMNKELSNRMKNCCEGAEHFNFFWNKKPARDLKSYIKSKIGEFAKDLKLIESENVKKNKIQKQAANNAIKHLSPLFKKLNLTGSGKGKKTKTVKTRRPNEKLRLSITNLKLPNENSRIDYGQKIKGAYVVPINEYKYDFFVLVKVWIESDDGQEIIIEERELNLRGGEKDIKIGSDLFEIDRKLHAGGYSFRAHMHSLEDTDIEIQIGKNKKRVEKGTELYNVSKKFYVETDPPEVGPFDFQPYPSDNKRQLIWHVYSAVDDALVFYYNNKHPKIKPIENDINLLTEYLVGQGTMLLYQIKIESLLESDNNTLDEFDPKLSEIVKSKNIEQIFPYLLEKYSETIWDYLK